MVARRADVEARAGVPAVALPAARSIGDEAVGLLVRAPAVAGIPDVEACATGGGMPAVDAGGGACAANAAPPLRRTINAGASRFLFMASLRG